MPQVRHKALMFKLFKYYISSKTKKINYSWIKEMGEKSLASKFPSQPLMVGKIHLSRSQSLSASSVVDTTSIALTPGPCLGIGAVMTLGVSGGSN